jgi:hypothetical protein
MYPQGAGPAIDVADCAINRLFPKAAAPAVDVTDCTITPDDPDSGLIFTSISRLTGRIRYRFSLIGGMVAATKHGSTPKRQSKLIPRAFLTLAVNRFICVKRALEGDRRRDPLSADRDSGRGSKRCLAAIQAVRKGVRRYGKRACRRSGPESYCAGI